MPCLYCGKELALLKRLRGGGEFCSEAHRLRYREEYDELALNRLLQAKPETAAPEESTAGVLTGNSAPTASPAAPVSNGAKPAAAAPLKPAPTVSERTPEPAATPARTSPKPEPPLKKEFEAKPPAPPAGYLLERIDAAQFDADEDRPALPESAPAIASAPSPALPSREASAAGDSEELWRLAGQLEINAMSAAEAAHELRGKNVEAREFVRSAPFTSVAMDVAGVNMLGPADAPVGVGMLPYPPSDATPWMAPEREFAPADPQLGEFAHLLFESTGVENGDIAAPPVEQAPTSNGPILAKLTPPPAAVVPHSASPVRVEPAVVRFVGDVARESEEPAPPAPTAAILQARAALPPRLETALTIPAPVIAAGRGRPVQLFSSPLVPSGVPKAPPFAAIPMRPRMVFGPPPTPPAPATPAPTVSTPIAKAQPAAPKKAAPAEATPPDARTPASPQTNPANPAPAAKTTSYKSAFLIPTDAEKPQSVRTPAERKQSRPAFPKPGEHEPKAPPKPTAPSPFVTPSSLKTLKEEAKRDEATGKESPSPFIHVKGGESLNREKPATPNEAKVTESKSVAPKAEPPKAAETKIPEPNPVATIDQKPKPSPEIEIDLGLPTLNIEAKQGFWSKLPMGARIGLAAGVLVAVGLAVYLNTGGTPATAKSPVVEDQGPIVRPGPPLMDATWLADWAPDTNVRRNRRISILKTATPLTDYRVQFEAQIENKAISWIYRAADPKNYYVNKVEVVKPGLEPTIALTRFALVNGQETPRIQVPLDLKVRVDTLYKVRFEAVGNQFTTWLQDKKVDQWTDDRFKTGGPGLYSEQGESEALRGTVNVIPLLVVQNQAKRGNQK